MHRKKKCNCNAVATEICGRNIYTLYRVNVTSETRPRFGLQFTTSSGAGWGREGAPRGVGSESDLSRSWPEPAPVIGYKCESSYAFCLVAADTPEAGSNNLGQLQHKLPLVRQVTKNRTLNLELGAVIGYRDKAKGRRNSYVAHIARFAFCNMLHQFTAAGTATAANHKVYGLLQSQTVIRSDALMNLSAVRQRLAPFSLSLCLPLSLSRSLALG